jgi:hypothetical protein
MAETFAEYMSKNSPDAKIKALEAEITLLKSNQDKIATVAKVEIVKEVAK